MEAINQTGADNPATEGSAALFQREWQTYRKVVDNNYMFHREVYGTLHRAIIEAMPRPFRFLDIACGDASATLPALADTQAVHYTGIDLSGPALALAETSLRSQPYGSTLIHGDFVAAIDGWSGAPVDVVWIGQSLHHLLTDAKQDFLRKLRGILPPDGLLLIWEPTTLPGEDRAGWLARFQAVSRPLWTELSDTEFDAMAAHVRAADYPETAPVWLALGRDAGFATADEVYVAPTRLARVYRFGMA